MVDSTFKSYILEEKQLESINLSDEQRTKFLDGETTVSEAHKVICYAPLTDRKKATIGILTITTFKLSFVHEDEQFTDGCSQHNLLLGPNDVCLSSIDAIYQLGERSKKKLSPGQNLSGRVKDLLIICKNMRCLEFSFKHADKDSGRNIVNALLHHCYPKRHSLLFAFDYTEPYDGAILTREVRLFRSRDDWKRELDRTKCPNWRPSLINENFQTSQTMMATLIVPQTVTDSLLTAAIEHFRNRFCPVWVWGTCKGAALVRMADLLPTVPDRMQENTLLEHIRRNHPDKKQPIIMDLNRDCPSPKDIQVSFVKLRELCVPENARVFQNQDIRFYGLLDATKWLTYVSACLTKATEASKQMSLNNFTVVLQEGNGQDLNCVVSCLTQLMLDPYFRTKFGFQSLIQKDWVAMGHPFAFRLGHILDKDVETCPVFLLFLDCVWQLLEQFPTAFQINETYLTTVWDSAHISTFDTFIFNCEHDRVIAEAGKLILRSVWDWSEQFGDKDIVLFCNPLYDDGHKAILQPGCAISQLDIWSQCYFRWLPNLEIRNGGKPQIDLRSRLIVAQILRLQQCINAADSTNGKVMTLNYDGDDVITDLLQNVNSFFPFSHNNGQMTDLLPLNNVLLTDLDTQSMLNLNND